MKKNSRSVSRVLYFTYAKCLSFISNKCRHLPLAIYPPTSGEQPYCVGIHDLATHKTYGFECCHPNRWALTSPFHPFHTRRCGGYFLLRYSALTNSFPLGNMVLYVARTFLYSFWEKRQTDLLFWCKDTDNILYYFLWFYRVYMHGYATRKILN